MKTDIFSSRERTIIVQERIFKFMTELKKGLLKTKNITIKGLGEINAKSDIGVEGKTINFGI